MWLQCKFGSCLLITYHLIMNRQNSNANVLKYQCVLSDQQKLEEATSEPWVRQCACQEKQKISSTRPVRKTQEPNSLEEVKVQYGSWRGMSPITGLCSFWIFSEHRLQPPLLLWTAWPEVRARRCWSPQYRAGSQLCQWTWPQQCKLWRPQLKPTVPQFKQFWHER